MDSKPPLKTPVSLAIAQKGVKTSNDFAALMSAMMTDLIEGTISPSVGNATVKAGANLLKIVELELRTKHGIERHKHLNGDGMVLIASEEPAVGPVLVERKAESASGYVTFDRRSEEDHSTLVLAAISPANGHRDTPGLIVSWMRKNGAPNISLTDVDRILRELARARKIKLKANEDDRWELVAKERLTQS